MSDSRFTKFGSDRGWCFVSGRRAHSTLVSGAHGARLSFTRIKLRRARQLVPGVSGAIATATTSAAAATTPAAASIAIFAIGLSGLAFVGGVQHRLVALRFGSGAIAAGAMPQEFAMIAL